MCDRVTVCARVSRRRRAVGACPVLRWWRVSLTGRRALHDNTFSENVAGQQNGQLLRIIATRNQK